MTKSTGVGRGGARPNSGPKAKPRAGKINLQSFNKINDEQSVADLAKQYTINAFEVLAHISAEGANEAARVSASKVLLEYAYGKPGPAAAAVGKKEQRKIDAQTSEVGSPWEELLN